MDGWREGKLRRLSKVFVSKVAPRLAVVIALVEGERTRANAGACLETRLR